MKILILMSYYQRPILVRNALQSILKANEHHSDWELVFGDDGSEIPGKPIVEEVLKDHLHKVQCIHTQMSLEDKLNFGLTVGKHANEAIRSSSAEIGIMLCDDDELHPMYLKNLSNFFIANPDTLYAYSKVHIYNPLLQKSEDISGLNCTYNQWRDPINPAGKVDASQVAWRLDCCKKYEAWFSETTKLTEHMPWIKDTDRSFFENLYSKCGLCTPTGFVGQYKGIHDYQLLWHKKACADDLRSYNKMIQQLAGVKF
jgi:uncharacterized CHY-type Zn-finger protein